MYSPVATCLALVVVPDFRVVLFDETDRWPSAVQEAAGSVQAAYVFNFSQPHRVLSMLPSYDGFYLYSRAAKKVSTDIQLQLVESDHALVDVVPGIRLFAQDQYSVGPTWESLEALAEHYLYIESYGSLLDSVIRNERTFRRW